MTEAIELHVYENDTDKVVARDAEDAWAVWCESIGERREDYEDSWDWEKVPSSTIISIGFEEADPNPALYEGLARLPSNDRIWEFRCKTTAADWAKRNGRGFLCSTEF